MLQDFGSTYETTYEAIKKVFVKIDNAYPGKKKVFFSPMIPMQIFF